MRYNRYAALAGGAMMLIAGAANAQPAPYGAPITLEQARKVYAAAEAESVKNKWNMAIAILDSGCNLVLLQKMDNTQLSSINIAQDKAWAACAYRRPTKVVQDLLAKGGDNLRYLQLHRMTAVDGGVPIIVDGKIIGAIGVSGAASHEDGQVAKVGIDALTK
jgi:uncharacterized protein GlcG (DUF336 family)